MRDQRMRRTDRRVQKTRQLLHAALASLIQEKAYDTISVKEILDRANVGKSTFYTHFSDKDELLASGLRDVLRSVQRLPPATPAGSRHEALIAFSLPVFEHIQGHRGATNASMGTRGRAILHELLQKVLVDLIAE